RRFRRERGVLAPAPRLALRVRARERRVSEHRRQGDVLMHAQVREGPRDLIGARYTKARDAMRRQLLDLPTGEGNAAGIGAVMAAHDVDERRLAGAVRPDEPEDLAAPHFQ